MQLFKEHVWDLLAATQHPNMNAVCITTNTTLLRNGNAIMGAGVARAFRQPLLGRNKRKDNTMNHKPTICDIALQIIHNEYPEGLHSDNEATLSRRVRNIGIAATCIHLIFGSLEAADFYTRRKDTARC